MSALVERVLRWMSAPVEAALDRRMAVVLTFPIPEQRSISPEMHPLWCTCDDCWERAAADHGRSL